MDCDISVGNHAARSILGSDGSTSSARFESNANGDPYGDGDRVGTGNPSGPSDGSGIGKLVEGEVAHVKIDAGGKSWCV